jgi:hypothetical protein
MRANFDATGTNEGVTAFLNSSTGLTSWSLTFDCFQLWNGPASVGGAIPAGTGTTTSFTFGNAATTRPFHTAPTDFNGWFVAFVAEGGNGASGDARYYSASNGTPTVALATPNWAINGGTPLPTDMPNGAGTALNTWETIFTAGNYEVPGTPGRQWVTWEIIAQAGSVKVSVTPKNGAKTQIANWVQSASQTIGLGFFDLNTSSVADPPSDNFVVIDNLHLDTAPVAPAGANDWSMFQ